MLLEEQDQYSALTQRYKQIIENPCPAQTAEEHRALLDIYLEFIAFGQKYPSQVGSALRYWFDVPTFMKTSSGDVENQRKNELAVLFEERPDKTIGIADIVEKLKENPLEIWQLLQILKVPFYDVLTLMSENETKTGTGKIKKNGTGSTSEVVLTQDTEVAIARV